LVALGWVVCDAAFGAFARDYVVLGEAGAHCAVRIGEPLLHLPVFLLACGQLRAGVLEFGASPVALRASSVSFVSHASTCLSARRPLFALRPGGLPEQVVDSSLRGGGDALCPSCVSRARLTLVLPPRRCVLPCGEPESEGGLAACGGGGPAGCVSAPRLPGRACGFRARLQLNFEHPCSA
jgi:hypothetical protein